MGLKTFFFGRTPLTVARSLCEEPEKWSGYFHQENGHCCELRHVGGAILWTGNAAYGMDVTGPGFRKWGGCTALSTAGLSPGHWLLRVAADRWIRAHSPGSEYRSIEALLASPPMSDTLL